MAKAPLTEKQAQVYNLLTDEKTPVEIAEALGVSKAAIYSHIRAIKEAGHPVSTKYANVGTGGGRGSAAKKTGRGRGRAAAKKAPTAVVPPTPTPAPTPTPTPEPTVAEVADAEAIVADLNTGMERHRQEITARLAAITEQVNSLQEAIAALDAEAKRLAETDATLEAMQHTLASGPPESASSGTPDLTGVAA